VFVTVTSHLILSFFPANILVNDCSVLIDSSNTTKMMAGNTGQELGDTWLNSLLKSGILFFTVSRC